jgi:hypothetical protein
VPPGKKKKEERKEQNIKEKLSDMEDRGGYANHIQIVRELQSGKHLNESSSKVKER